VTLKVTDYEFVSVDSYGIATVN